jgi:hypothetical protein
MENPGSSKIPMISMVVNWIAIIAFGWQIFGNLSSVRSKLDLIEYRLLKIEESKALK